MAVEKRQESPWAKMPIDLMADETFSRGDLVVAAYMFYRSGTRGYFWETQETIADQLGLSRATVVRAIQKLVDAAYFAVSRNGRTQTNTYHVLARTVDFESATSHRWNLRHRTGDTSEVAPVIHPSNTTIETNHRPLPEGGANAPRAPKAQPIDEEFCDEMTAEFGGRLGGAVRVQEIIATALNHKASDKWKNKRQGIRDWLRRDSEKAGVPTADRAEPDEDDGKWGPPPGLTPEEHAVWREAHGDQQAADWIRNREKQKELMNATAH